MSAAVINPTAFLPHHTSHCTSEDDAFPILSYRSLARTGRYVLGTSTTGVSSVATSTRSVKSHFWFLARRFYHSRTRIGSISSRARPAQSENIAINNPIDWGHTDKDAVTMVRSAFFYPSNFVPLNLTSPKQITWDMLKKNGRDATCGVWTTSSACQLRAWSSSP